MAIVNLEANYKPSPAEVEYEMKKLDPQTHERVTRIIKRITDLLRPDDFVIDYAEGKTAQQLNEQVVPEFERGSRRFVRGVAPYYDGNPRLSQGLKNLWERIGESFIWESQARFAPARILMAHGRHLIGRFMDRDSLLDPVRAVTFALVSDSKRFPSKENPYRSLLDLHNLDPELIALAEVGIKTPQGIKTLEELHGHFLVNLQSGEIPNVAQTCLRMTGAIGLREPKITTYFPGEDCNQRMLLPKLMPSKFPVARILHI